jgi:hypothetical protein
MAGKNGVNVNPPTPLWQRLRFAATLKNVSLRHYCRDLLVTWLSGPRLALDEIDRGNRERHDTFVPLSAHLSVEFRVAAARLGVGHSDLALRVLDAGAPQTSEVGAELLGVMAVGE